MPTGHRISYYLSDPTMNDYLEVKFEPLVKQPKQKLAEPSTTC
jgi:hypothetical protein